jgi:hypothetical protein
VNDRAVSDVENAYIFDTKTLARVDLTSAIGTAVRPDDEYLRSA